MRLYGDLQGRGGIIEESSSSAFISEEDGTKELSSSFSSMTEESPQVFAFKSGQGATLQRPIQEFGMRLKNGKDKAVPLVSKLSKLPSSK